MWSKWAQPPLIIFQFIQICATCRLLFAFQIWWFFNVMKNWITESPFKLTLLLFIVCLIYFIVCYVLLFIPHSTVWCTCACGCGSRRLNHRGWKICLWRQEEVFQRTSGPSHPPRSRDKVSTRTSWQRSKNFWHLLFALLQFIVELAYITYL